MNKQEKVFLVPSNYQELVADYQNTAAINDAIHTQFTSETWAEKSLADHRRFIEKNKMGFGDAAFHAMWALILKEAVVRHKKVRVLEIGVFKGQVISLWALLAKTHNWPIEITAITPLKGTPLPKNKMLQKIKWIISTKYRERVKNNDFYKEENYEEIIKAVFKRFTLEYSNIRILKGFSTDQKVIREAKDLQFEILYVDGDHTFDGALHDFQVFGSKVVKGGWLVADDAGCALPGTRFWKGHEAVSRAVEILPTLGFKNVFNVGHNRVFEKVCGS